MPPTKPLRSESYMISWIPLTKISVVWADAQRPFNEREARRIAAIFDPDALDPVVVTLPDASGMHHCIDGQTRCGAARIALGLDQQVPCRVINTSSPAEAARIWLAINTSHSRAGALAQFLVALTAGNEEAVAIDRLVGQLGYKIGSAGQERVIHAIAACQAVYRRFNAEILRDTLLFIQGCFGYDRASVETAWIRGVAAFLAKYGGTGLDRVRLADKVAKTGPAGMLLGKARLNAESRKCTVAEGVAHLLVQIHDSGLRLGRLDPRKDP